MTAAPEVVLLFPGQGAQQPRMAAGLYQVSESFTHWMDQAFTLLGPDGPRLRELWLAERPPACFDDITCAQPLLFAVNHAMGRMLMDAGVRLSALLGHSVGELAAATLAGVFEFADGLSVLRDFVRGYGRAPRGGMLAVAADLAQVRPYLRGDVVVGAVNGPRQLLLAGPDPELGEAEAELRAAGVSCARAKARQPFHSPVMSRVVTEADRQAWRPPLRPPRIPVCSAYLGGPLDGATATDWDFWFAGPASPVHFGPALDRLLATGRHVLVEAGPGQSLTALVRRTSAAREGRAAVAPALPARRGGGETDRRAVREALAQLREHGCVLDPKPGGSAGHAVNTDRPGGRAPDLVPGRDRPAR
ncbi:acyltransferase domain-containing protein [Crossiella sp. SN42]|uniref:acyltransferase domain-containing protein n=1 Tax=Crossiella sp. SN42 TaxID=2944808 RepID=UPI00207C7FAA|nr:acyltransferase domain-containing protein [Crossiella sp. SN42]MCO1575099.1 acyltransferase domain-containing protein [Crossiella sp. SN42]